MYPVQKGDTLSRITTYELYRDHLPLQIRICFVLAGLNEGKFAAYIYGHDIAVAGQWAVADTEQAALHECLSKIRRMTRDQIVAAS